MWSGGGQGRILRAGAPHLRQGSLQLLLPPFALSLLCGFGDGAGGWKVGGRLSFIFLEISREIIIIIDTLQRVLTKCLVLFSLNPR